MAVRIGWISVFFRVKCRSFAVIWSKFVRMLEFGKCGNPLPQKLGETIQRIPYQPKGISVRLTAPNHVRVTDPGSRIISKPWWYLVDRGLEDRLEDVQLLLKTIVFRVRLGALQSTHPHCEFQSRTCVSNEDWRTALAYHYPRLDGMMYLCPCTRLYYTMNRYEAAWCPQTTQCTLDRSMNLLWIDFWETRN